MIEYKNIVQIHMLKNNTNQREAVKMIIEHCYKIREDLNSPHAHLTSITDRECFEYTYFLMLHRRGLMKYFRYRLIWFLIRPTKHDFKQLFRCRKRK